MTDLSALTTLGVGGPAEHILEPRTRDELLAELSRLWDDGEEPLLLGGGSNVLISDEGYPGTVIRIAHTGIERIDTADGRVRLRVAAGVRWDDLVAFSVEQGWSGLEALSGIPGSVGAAPIQNIGAYGQELASVLVAVELLDYYALAPVWVPADDLELGYRTSTLKRHEGGVPDREAVVLTVELNLGNEAGLSAPIGYAQLAKALGVTEGDRLPVADIREAVLGLRRSKGMVYDRADRDTHSAGSFFTNPVVSARFARTLPADAPRWPVIADDDEPTVIALENFDGSVPAPRGELAPVKLSAAWLIEHAGIPKGFHLPGSRAAISSKHTLALTNAGNATAQEIAGLATYVQTIVESEFGVRLRPEPVLVGIEL